MSKKALITGVTGQDGSYMAEMLLDKGYEVHGLKRRLSSYNEYRLKNVYMNSNFHMHGGDMTDAVGLASILNKIRPDEIYNFAAQSNVQASFDSPDYTATVDALGPHRLLESMRFLEMNNTKLYQACSTEIFYPTDGFQNEQSKIGPRTPYGISKLYAYYSVISYRETYGLYACNGLLFNHESPRRGDDFVTKKIAKTLCKISNGEDTILKLGNIDVKKDWGHAKDFVEAFWLMLQMEKPDDYVIATGKNYSVRDFVKYCAEFFNFDLIWQGEGVDEVGIDLNTNKVIVSISPDFFRPTQSNNTLGDYSHAKKILGWEPKTSFKELAYDMCSFEQTEIRN